MCGDENTGKDELRLVVIADTVVRHLEMRMASAM